QLQTHILMINPTPIWPARRINHKHNVHIPKTIHHNSPIPKRSPPVNGTYVRPHSNPSVCPISSLPTSAGTEEERLNLSPSPNNFLDSAPAPVGPADSWAATAPPAILFPLHAWARCPVLPHE